MIVGNLSNVNALHPPRLRFLMSQATEEGAPCLN